MGRRNESVNARFTAGAALRERRTTNQSTASSPATNSATSSAASSSCSARIRTAKDCCGRRDRVATSLAWLTRGYEMDVQQVVGGALFDAEGASNMVMVRDIELYIAVRASHAAVLRQGAHRLHPGRQDRRA